MADGGPTSRRHGTLPLELPTSVDGWAAFIRSRCDGQLALARSVADLLRSDRTDRQTTLERWNQVSLALLNAANAAHLIVDVHPDERVRAQASAAELDASALTGELTGDPDIFHVLATVDPAGLDEEAARMLAMTLRDFRRAGAEFATGKRHRVRDLTTREGELVQTFHRNISEDRRSVSLTVEQLRGLPEDYLAAHPPDDAGQVTVSTDYPDAVPLLTFGHDAEARRLVAAAMRNRGWPANDPVLTELLRLRAERAHLLGYPTAVDYDAEVRMTGSAAAVAEFLDAVTGAMAEAAAVEAAQLLARKQRDEPTSTVLEWSDYAYYARVLEEERVGLDGLRLRAHLDFEQVRDGLLELAGQLFGLVFEPRPDLPAWHEDVATYDVRMDGQLRGRIYLDLHPRPGKYSHAQHLPLAKGVRGVQLPHSALVCNLPRGPLDLDDVTTLFHELGHLVHAVVAGDQRWARFSGVATERDFAEAPSMLMEEWIRDSTVLRRLTSAGHKQMPADLAEQVRHAGCVARAFGLQIQVYWSMLCYRLHHEPPEDLAATAREVALKHHPACVPDDVHPYAGLVHIADPKYASTYYTYLWSLVIAKDLFSAFDREDLLDQSVTARYRDDVLAPGGSRDAADLVRSFLGRQWGAAEFALWLAGEPGES